MNWWEDCKEILVRENIRLKEYKLLKEFAFVIRDNNLWLLGVVFLDSDQKFPFSFECKYPKSYPFAPPYIYPKDKDTGWVAGHQFVLEGRFCLDIREYNWLSSMSAVDIIESMRILVLASFDKYLNKRKKLNVKEGVEPTQLEIKTKEIRCLYSSDSNLFNKSYGVFDYFSFKELEDNRIIIRPELKDKKDILTYFTSELFNIWDFNIFYSIKGVYILTTQSVIQLVSYYKTLSDFYDLLQKEIAVEKAILLDQLKKNDSEYVLLVNEHKMPVLLLKIDDKKDKIEHFGCYKIDFGKLQDRIPNKDNYALLSQRKVTIIGCGSGGGAIAENLVKAGIQKFVLIDPEILETENIFRHNCTLRDIGLKKTYALKKRLQEINPQITFQVINEKIDSIKENVDLAIKDSDIIINATGSSENLINHYCYSRNITAIHAKVYPFGFGGEVISVIPEIHPCFECQNQQLNKLLDEIPKISEFPLNKTIDYNITDEGDTIAIPSLAIDASFINNITAKMTIDILLTDFEKLESTPNIILWGNEKEWIFEQNYSCKKVDTSNFNPLKNCIICNNKTSIKTELSMSPDEISAYYHQLKLE